MLFRAGFSLVLILAAGAAQAAEPLRVGVVVFDGFLTSEVAAPLEVFGKASEKGSQRFEVLTVAAGKGLVKSHEGLLIQPSTTFAACPPLEILVVPSALDMEPILASQALLDFIKERGPRTKWLASHCAGAFLLGKAGLLDGRSATTYIGGAESLQQACPRARVQGDKHVVIDGNVVTSIGGAVSYEGSLALLERIAGSKLADQVADALSYFRWRETKARASTN